MANGSEMTPITGSEVTPITSYMGGQLWNSHNLLDQIDRIRLIDTDPRLGATVPERIARLQRSLPAALLSRVLLGVGIGVVLGAIGSMIARRRAQAETAEARRELGDLAAVEIAPGTYALSPSAEGHPVALDVARDAADNGLRVVVTSDLSRMTIVRPEDAQMLDGQRDDRGATIIAVSESV